MGCTYEPGYRYTSTLAEWRERQDDSLLEKFCAFMLALGLPFLFVSGIGAGIEHSRLARISVEGNKVGIVSTDSRISRFQDEMLFSTPTDQRYTFNSSGSRQGFYE